MRSRHRIVHVHNDYLEGRTLGQRAADAISSGMGSWAFLIIQSAILAVWIMLNAAFHWFPAWDPYPFILMNLVLSMQAAYAAPIIMMSARRQDAKDRIRSEADYHTDLHAAETGDEINRKLDLLLAFHKIVEDDGK